LYVIFLLITFNQPLINTDKKMLTKTQLKTLFNDLDETASNRYEAELEKGDKYDGYADPIDFVHGLNIDATDTDAFNQVYKMLEDDYSEEQIEMIFATVLDNWKKKADLSDVRYNYFDRMEYNKNPTAYYGMSESDF
jgi:hypothetical protein